MEVPIKRLMRTGLRKGGGIFMRMYSGIYMNNIYIYIYVYIGVCMYEIDAGQVSGDDGGLEAKIFIYIYVYIYTYSYMYVFIYAIYVWIHVYIYMYA